MLELITAALVAGAASGVTGVATEAIKDAYAGLKNVIGAKFGKTKSAIDALEDDPKDEDAQKLAAKRLTEANAAADADVQAAADKLLAALKAAGIPVATTTQTATGDGNVQIAGSGNSVTSNVSTGNSGINVQGSTTGDIMYGDNVHGDKIGGDKIGKQVNTGGGAYIGGNASAEGDIVGRDKIVHNYNTAPELSAINTASARALVPLLNEYFAISDIDSLCFEMGIDDEQLRGQTKDEKARSLVKFVEQNERLDELKRLMRVARPNLRNQLS